MAEELSELSPFEKAALTVKLRGLGGRDLLQVMRKAQPGWSDSTYYRRLDEALVSLERKALVVRAVAKGGYVDRHVTKKVAKLLSPEQLFEDCMYLAAKTEELTVLSSDLSAQLRDLRQQLDAERAKTSTIQKELDSLRKERRSSLEERLIAKFPSLNLKVEWVEALVLIALVEMMVRHKLATLQPGEVKDKGFTDLINTLKKVMPETEGRNLDFNKELVNGLYDFRHKMIHNGLSASVSHKEVEGIAALVENMYQQLF